MGVSSSRHGHAVRERYRRRLGDAELCAQGTRVCPFLPRAAKADVARACRSENRDKTETYLAFGASRFEACRPLVVEALRLSLMPVINQMRCAARTFVVPSLIWPQRDGHHCDTRDDVGCDPR